MITWTPEMSVNVREIDDQHKHFVGLMNELYSTAFQGGAKEKLAEILNKLVDYTNLHFQTEEKYFEQFQYELTAEHEKLHNELKVKVATFVERFRVEGESIIAELMDFLEDWLVDHLENQDKKYTKCFNEHGLF